MLVWFLPFLVSAGMCHVCSFWSGDKLGKQFSSSVAGSRDLGQAFRLVSALTCRAISPACGLVSYGRPQQAVMFHVSLLRHLYAGALVLL